MRNRADVKLSEISAISVSSIEFTQAIVIKINDGSLSSLEMIILCNINNNNNNRLLLQNNDIVIRPANKGSGIVIMDKEKYVQKVEEDLKQGKTYKGLQKSNSHQRGGVQCISLTNSGICLNCVVTTSKVFMCYN